jgi:hypothetical protein
MRKISTNNAASEIPQEASRKFFSSQAANRIEDREEKSESSMP